MKLLKFLAIANLVVTSLLLWRITTLENDLVGRGLRRPAAGFLGDMSLQIDGVRSDLQSIETRIDNIEVALTR